jgi:hypothetical protein
VALDINDRLKFLINKFDILDEDKVGSKIKKLVDSDFNVSKIESDDGDLLAIVYYPNTGKPKTNVSISNYVFDMMVKSDPAKNKMYTQSEKVMEMHRAEAQPKKVKK